MKYTGKSGSRAKLIIDKKKFTDEMKRRGLNYEDLGEATGYTGKGISSMVSQCYINPIVAKALEHEFNWNREQYLVPDEPEKSEDVGVIDNIEHDRALRQPLEMSEQFQKDLYKVIYAAVYNALKN